MASMRFGTLQLCDEHACKSATKTSTEVAHFYAATWTHFTLRLTVALGFGGVHGEGMGHMNRRIDIRSRIGSHHTPEHGGSEAAGEGYISREGFEIIPELRQNPKLLMSYDAKIV